MATLDIFQDDAFSAIELTQGLEHIDFQPNFLGSLGIFRPKPLRTTTVMVEERDGVLSLIPQTPRGAPPTQQVTTGRTVRAFPTGRIAKSDRIMADELQSIRAFGSETELAGVQQEVARRAAMLRGDTELTHEFMRLGAVQGIVTDADGSTIRNWFTEFGIAQPAEVDFELDDPATVVRTKCHAIVRAMERAAKGGFTPATQVHALCADDFFDALIEHDSVKDTYKNWSAAEGLRTNLAFRSFPFAGIMFHNYRGTDDNSTVAIPAGKVKFFPVGASDTFEVAWSPMESTEFVNTLGRPTYYRTVPDRDRQFWVDVEAYSYPLFICRRPGVLQRGKKQ